MSLDRETRIIFKTQDFESSDSGVLVLGLYNDDRCQRVQVHQMYRDGSMVRTHCVTLDFEIWYRINKKIVEGSARPTTPAELRKLTGHSDFHFDGPNAPNSGNTEHRV